MRPEVESGSHLAREYSRSSGIRQELGNLAAGQKLQTERFMLLGVNIDQPKSLFGWYLRSPAFRNSYTELSLRYHVPRSDEELRELRRVYAGKVFEDLSYFSQSILNYPDVLLSPQRTFIFWHVLFPEEKVVVHEFEGRSLYGIGVPDGLIVRRANKGHPVIREVVEYSAGVRDVQYFQHKIKTLNATRSRLIRNEDTRSVLQEAHLLFVVPNEEKLPSVAGASEEDFVRMPFTRKEFGDFVNDIIYGKFLDRYEARLSDLQAIVRRRKPRNLKAQLYPA